MTGVAVAVAVAAAWEAEPVAAGPERRPTAIVALGDSFISGEGGRWLGNGTEPLGTRSGTDRAAFGCDGWLCEYDPARVYGPSEENDCHRSDVAPIVSAPIAVSERVNLACSGARLANLWPAARGGRSHFGEPPQADQLAAVARRLDLRMVVLTAGANDVGFGELVAGCALDWARGDEEDPVLCRGEADAALRARLPAAERGLRRALLRDQAAHARHKFGDGLDATMRDLRHRATGTVAELRSRLRRDRVEDEILYERVRSGIGRAVSHPHAITVIVQDG